MLQKKFKGGYNIPLQGRPDRAIKQMPQPQMFYIPLSSRRFVFSKICDGNGRQVKTGEVLAKDPDNYDVPLLAPLPGTVNLQTAEKHIVLEILAEPAEHPPVPQMQPPHIVQKPGTADTRRNKLLRLGAWQFFYDAYTDKLPDPIGTPQAVIVSTLRLEPFLARGDVLLHDKFLNFTRGLEQLQSLLEYQQIFLVMPDIHSALATKVRNQIRGYAWAELVEIPIKYPHDSFNILARHLGLKKDAGPVWAIRTEGILAIDNALTLGKPCTSRIISVGGPAVNSPTHIELTTGYPINKITDMFASEDDIRVINGGILTGQSTETQNLGLDAECTGITILPEHTERELFGFARPGSDRTSFSGCFLSSLRKKIDETLTTALRGELRPCITCNFCEQICPAGIMPHQIHKFLYAELIEEAQQARIDLCIECGLCSFVCPSKIDLKNEFVEAKKQIEKEKEEIRKEKERQEKLQQQTSEKTTEEKTQ
ncbi:4Fe-4S dicluster domain-containing protein [Planctomycetota bacterium]